MERLQKVIAHAGVASRRKAEQLIVEGKVKVNGKVVTELGVKVSPQDRIEVDGIPLEREEPVYYLLYKPRGVISSVKDEKGRKVVTDFFKHVNKRIYPIGRLDYDTSGLLLLTNDGEFANILM
ncbi:MAG: pseudouridine synthase, partial [Anoxybacillus ayderensis]|nr:pseudouridine synthase [Anoxybacillus ayderensis]